MNYHHKKTAAAATTITAVNYDRLTESCYEAQITMKDVPRTYNSRGNITAIKNTEISGAARATPSPPTTVIVAA